MSFIKALIFTLLAVFASILVAAGISEADRLLGIRQFEPPFVAGLILLVVGAALRFWPTYLFYQKKMRVISRKPQQHLVTSGPYKFSRNPLYIGLILIFLGASLTAGSYSSLILTVVFFIALNAWAKVEERQLETAFGQEYLEYKNRVRRWL